MSKFKFELNRKGVSDLMKSEPMRNVLDSYANAVQKRAGNGYEAKVARPNKTRAGAVVMATTYQAKADNSRNNTLLKALGG